MKNALILRVNCLKFLDYDFKIRNQAIYYSGIPVNGRVCFGETRVQQRKNPKAFLFNL